jgi:pimeloyl-ACP methyl ester carboxylesterase
MATTIKHVEPAAPRDRDTVTSPDGTTIAYDIHGHGPAVLLVPGAFHAGHHYHALAHHLADSFTVYAVNRRGRPGSGPQRSDHGIDAECADLIAILDKTGASMIFGHSSGAVVSLQTTRRHPVKKLAVYEPPVSINGSVPNGFLPAFERAVSNGRKVDAFAILAKGQGISGIVGKLPLAALKILFRLGSRSEPNLAEYIDLVGTFPAEQKMITKLDADADRYGEVDTETLILLGDRTQPYLTRAAHFLDEVMPNSQLLTLTGLDHEGPEDQPAPVAAQLRNFFDNP